jgi:hypothetical protein
MCGRLGWTLTVGATIHVGDFTPSNLGQGCFSSSIRVATLIDWYMWKYVYLSGCFQQRQDVLPIRPSGRWGSGQEGLQLQEEDTETTQGDGSGNWGFCSQARTWGIELVE